MHVQRFDFREFSSGDVVNDNGDQAAFRKNVVKAQKAAQQEAPPPPPPPPPPAPTFSEDEMRAAELRGYQRGFQEGMEDGKKQGDAAAVEREQKLLEHVEGFVRTITPLFEQYRQMALDLTTQMPQVALAIARKVAGAALEQNAPEIVQAMVLSACESMIKEPKLTITVHESMGDLLAKQLQILTDRLQAGNDIIILRDPDMPLADCRVEWKHGVMERKTDAIWQQVEDATENMVVSAKRDTNAHLDDMQADLPVEKPSLDNKE
jgi:flagellar assembly protein FliH